MTGNQMLVRILFIHWTLKLNGLACFGVGAMNQKSLDITDTEVAEGLLTKSKRIMYRDPANHNEHYLLGAYQKDRGSQLLVVLESNTNKESVCSLFSLHCHGQRDAQTDKLLRALQAQVGEARTERERTTQLATTRTQVTTTRPAVEPTMLAVVKQDSSVAGQEKEKTTEEEAAVQKEKDDDEEANKPSTAATRATDFAIKKLSSVCPGSDSPK